jgi:hypothetical protein
MKETKMKNKILYLLSATWFLPTLAKAATPPPPPVAPVTGGTTDVENIITKVIGWFFGITGALAVLFIIYGGVLYIVSAGNSDRQKQAKQTLIWAVIGLAVVVLSYFIVSLVLNITKVIT